MNVTKTSLLCSYDHALFLRERTEPMRQTLLISMILGALYSTSAAHAAGNDPVIAKLGSTELRQSQVKSLLNDFDEATRKQLLADPEAINLLVRKEVIRMSVTREALDKQWDKRPEIQSQLDHAREQVIVTSYLNSIARPASEFPSEAEIKQAYEAGKNSLATPAQYHIAQIYFAKANNSGDQESVARKAGEVSAKTRSADFAQLASQYSEHKASAAQGGDMGWLPETQLIPELREQLPNMKAGEVSKPIATGSGWHIVKLLETKAPGVPSLAEAREIISAGLRMKKAKQLEQQYLEELLKAKPLSINEIALAELLK